MPNGQPAQLANLRPPWSRGTAPRGERTRRSRDVDKAITLLRKYSPQAVKLIREVMLDESEPIAMRVKCAEILLNKAIPTSGSRGAQLTADGESGIDWLELRFVAPGAQPQTPPETLRITFDGDESVDESMGKIIDAEA